MGTTTTTTMTTSARGGAQEARPPLQKKATLFSSDRCETIRLTTTEGPGFIHDPPVIQDGRNVRKEEGRKKKIPASL